MEILTLLGMPPVVNDNGSETRATTMFAIGQVTHQMDTTATGQNQPGAMFNTAAATPSTDGWLNFGHEFDITANSASFKDDTYDRMVIGFRVVNKGGFRGDNGQNPYIYAIAVCKPAAGNSGIQTPLPVAPHLTGDEGQYFEIVVDYKTGKLDYYIDGGFIASAKFNAPQGLDPAYYLGFRIHADQTQLPYTSPYISGYYRDIYLGGLAVGEVFEPLGDLTVTTLPTASTTLSPSLLGSGNFEKWGGGADFQTVLDTAGTKLYTQTYVDPTPLKTAFAISGICSSISGLGYVEAGSNGTKIAGETKVRLRPTTRILKIKPEDIGNDLTVSFKLDP